MVERLQHEVAPLVGARIEIVGKILEDARKRVAPLVGARIEIGFGAKICIIAWCRSPRGSAD